MQVNWTVLLHLLMLICIRQKFLVTGAFPVRILKVFPVNLDRCVSNRTIELSGGKIDIDGYDISGISLETLRGRLALVPQDSTLFLGTLRENLCAFYIVSNARIDLQKISSDPQRLRTDAELISVLQRAWLLPSDGSSDPVAEAKFSLDSTVGDEGGLIIYSYH